MPTQEDLNLAIENARQNGANPGRVDEDVSPIVAAAAGIGLVLKTSEAYLIWREHSRSVSAGWLSPRNAEEIQHAIRIFIIDNEG